MHDWSMYMSTQLFRINYLYMKYKDKLVNMARLTAYIMFVFTKENNPDCH